MKKLFFTILAVFTILIVAEALCRFAWPENAKAPPYMRFTNPHREQSGFIPDNELFWKLKPNNPVWKVNSVGFRGPEIANDKLDGEYRILCLGDSCTFGLGAGGVPYDKTYPAIIGKELFPAILERVLLDDFPKKNYTRFQAMNFGCPGYTSYQGLKLLQKRIESIKPDVVIAYFGINDGFEAVGYSDKDQRPVELESKVLNSFLSKSSLYTSLTRLVIGTKQRTNSQIPVERVAIEDYHANLDDIATLANKYNAKAYFIAPPYLEADGSLNCEIHRIHEPAIDVMPNLKIAVADGEKVIFPAPDNVHPTPAGHAAIARAIVQRLINDMEWR